VCQDAASGHWHVEKLQPGSPAATIGFIEQGDLVSRIADIAVRGLTKLEVSALLVGPKGSIVKVDLRRSTADRHSPAFDRRFSVNLERTCESEEKDVVCGQEEKVSSQDGFRDAFEAMHATFARRVAAGERISNIVPSLVFAAHPPSTVPDDQPGKLALNSRAHAAADKTRVPYVGTPFMYKYDWSPFASAAAKAEQGVGGVGGGQAAARAREAASAPAVLSPRAPALSQVPLQVPLLPCHYRAAAPLDAADKRCPGSAWRKASQAPRVTPRVTPRPWCAAARAARAASRRGPRHPARAVPSERLRACA
jgi:hypothetical protein